MLFKTIIAIASVNRPQILHETVVGLQRQSASDFEILVCIAAASDCSTETARLPSVRVITSPRGLTRQRNCILDAVGEETEIVVFLDDDVELDPLYLENSIRFLASHADVTAFSGNVIADGSTAEEISRDAAKTLLDNSPATEDLVMDSIGLYGCNMVVRAAMARRVRFDERLHLYGLFEDVDFGERARAHGRIVWVLSCRLVHLAAKSGRISPRRMGYSQITNPLYLLRKRSANRGYLIKLLRNVILGNLVGLLVTHRGKSRLLRLGQLRGNIEAFVDFVRYGADPERISRIT